MLNAYPDSIGEKFSDTVAATQSSRMFFFAIRSAYFF
jgi:hypothetical protein